MAGAVAKITQQQLESHLWGAADILRGKIDSSDYKHYIFGLLFFQRLCDVWQEEYEERLARYGLVRLRNASARLHPRLRGARTRSGDLALSRRGGVE